MIRYFSWYIMCALDDNWLDRWIIYDHKNLYVNNNSKTKLLPILLRLSGERVPMNQTTWFGFWFPDLNLIKLKYILFAGLEYCRTYDLFAWRELRRVLRFSRMLIKTLQFSFWNFLDQPSKTTDQLIIPDYPSHLFIVKTDHIQLVKNLSSGVT